MPRGRKRSVKFKLKKDSLKSAFAVFLLVLGGLSFFSLLTDNGSVLSILHDFQADLFGYGAIFFPLILALFALLLLSFIKWKFVQIRVLLGLILSLITISAFSSLAFDNQTGGQLGTAVKDILKGAVTVYGAVLVLLAFLVFSFILIFDISLEKVFEALVALKEKFNLALPTKGKIPVLGGNFENENTTSEVATGKGSKHLTYEVIPSLSEPLDFRGRSDKSSIGSGSAIQSTLPYVDRVWEYPPIELLTDSPSTPADRGDVKVRQQIIEKTLASFGIKARVAEINFGPAVTQYALEISSVTKIAKVTNLQNDIALALASPTGSVRVEAPIPGKSLIGIEVPNITTALVSFKSMVTSDAMKSSKSKLTISLGHNVSGQPLIGDISKMPHLLIAGSTGSGKSIFLHSLLFSILFRCSPSECKFIMVDPKRVELVHYNDIPHLLTPVITDPEKAPAAFKWAVSEMERRYKLFENAKVRNINSYNELSGFQALPFILLVVDELAELMALQPVEMEKAIIRISQLSRATGIHLVLATQSPRVDVITGLIKANIPTRIAFSVASQIESRIIVDTMGAEKLLGKGDMLYVPPETSKPTRIQGVFVTEREIANLVTFLKNSGVKPDFKDEVTRQAQASELEMSESTDELFEEAVKIVSLSDRASASLLQRKLSIGYARSARLLDELEAKGIVGPADGSKPREVFRRTTENVYDPHQGVE